ncbi:hypothetical protein RBH29_16920 [Herbivorax sp. ANBcel31]|uniref:hypothetical protein n=1 Tax=Herbivorax sp. ANBcel31 TaxID=3069754 RepID=UPI0027B73E80|nr:hypothetical protein [Herbivorax sp. ANBcel31]MDQ2088111.1 hypothetical protein [Herbivorax sp. ANBcel31]
MKNIKKNRAIIMLIICILLVAVFFIQFHERKKIESEISSVLNHEVYKLTHTIVDKYNISNKILETNTVTLGQAEKLERYAGDFRYYCRYLCRVGYETGEYEYSIFKNSMYETMDGIELFIYNLIDEYNEGERLKDNDILIKLDSDLNAAFNYINDLYWKWLCAINLENNVVSTNSRPIKRTDSIISTEFEYYEEYYKNIAFKDDRWIDMINALQYETDEFLKEFTPQMEALNESLLN